MVVCVRAVFVLDLHGDDRPAVVVEQRLHLFGHRIQIGLAGSKKAWVAAAHANVALAEQPGRIPAGFPLCAGVRAGPQDDIQPLRGSFLHERGHVVVAGKIELALLRFHQIPEHVGFHRVQAQRTRFLQAVFPVGARNALEMDGAGKQLIRLAVAHELCALRAEVRPALGVCGCSSDRQREGERQNERCKGGTQHE